MACAMWHVAAKSAYTVRIRASSTPADSGDRLSMHRLSTSLLLRYVPFDCLPQPLFKPRLGLETKYPVCPTRLQAPAWLTVGSCCIPHDPSLKASQTGDHFH